MDLVKVLAQLRDELANLDAAILSLERLQHEGASRSRGRPPKSLSAIRAAATKRRAVSAEPSEHEGD
jgi:hypothetical protein